MLEARVAELEAQLAVAGVTAAENYPAVYYCSHCHRLVPFAQSLGFYLVK